MNGFGFSIVVLFLVALGSVGFWLIDQTPAWLMSLVGSGFIVGLVVLGFVLIHKAAKRWL